MSIKEKQSYALSWRVVNDFISEEVTSIVGHPIRCEAWPDEVDYWAVTLVDYRMPMSELMQLFEEVQADKETMREGIPNDSNTVKELGMLLASRLLQRRLGYQWERVIADDEGLWIVGCCATNSLNIGRRRVSFEELKTKDELMNWLVENGATHKELMDFCEDYRNKYQNELCWHYPISDGKHLGTYLVLVKEGILSLPYDEANKEDYEVFTVEDVRLFRKACDMSDFISDWDNFANDLRNIMIAMFHYLGRLEEDQNDDPSLSDCP